jgi:hypothetical protein
MKKLTVLLTGVEIALIATAVLYLAFHGPWATLVGVACVAVALVVAARLAFTRRVGDGLAVGVGTVCTVGSDQSATADGDRHILIQVTGVRGEMFIGRLMHRDGDLDLSMLRPGLVVLVAFDPHAREQLSLPDDVVAVRASCVKPG